MKKNNKQITFTSIAALGAASTASAAITHINTPLELTNDGDIWFLEGAGGSTQLARFGIFNGGSVSFPQTSGVFNNFELAARGDVAGNSSDYQVKRLTFEAAVTSGIFTADPASTFRHAFVATGTFQSAWDKDFDLDTAGYIGFRFNTGAGLQYGWASLTWNDDNNDVTINEWAYADVGESINVGQLPAAVPESETVASALGLLVLGAAGMRRYQNRKRPSTEA